MEPIELRRRDVGELFGLAFRIYRERFADMARAVAVVVIPVSIFTALLLAVLIPADESGGELGEFGRPRTVQGEDVDPLAQADGGDLAILFVGLAVGGGLSVMAAHLSTASALRTVAGAYLGDRPPWGDSVTFAFRRFWPLIWLQAISGVLVFIALLALVIPGLYLVVAWALAVPVLLVENRKGMAALSRSRELIRGRWWPTLGLLFLVGGAGAIVSGVLTPLVAGLLPAGSHLARAASEGVASGVVAVLTTPFAAAALTALYFDSRVRKEHFDIADLRRELSEGEQQPQW